MPAVGFSLFKKQEPTMNITAELSLYPLMANYVPTIQSYIDELNAIDELEIRTNALSTEVFGEYTLVMQTIQDLTYTVFCAEPAAVLVAKYVNRDRRDESQT
jgi:uncharacterized protein YqgV (UPF0045/DUF77 family)